MTVDTRHRATVTRTRMLTAICAVVFLVLVTACSSSQGETTSKTQLDTPVDASLMKTLRQASRNSLDNAIVPDQVALKSIPGWPVNPGDKPTVLYMGADYCPYCAAIRWPIVVALLRFGDFSGLKYMRSSHDDVYSDTVTFSFHGANYSSDYISLQAVELQDRDQQTLEKPGAQQISIFRKFDMKPYTASPGAIPFLYLDGQYMQSGSPFNPGVLKDMAWNDVAKALGDDGSAGRAIMGAANVYSAAICRLTDGQPENVCESKAVSNAAAQLPK